MLSMIHHAKTGILIHGRHLQAIEWEQMIWGDVENAKLGTLPTAILAALNEGVDNIALITLGTGASHDETGAPEAQVKAS